MIGKAHVRAGVRTPRSARRLLWLFSAVVALGACSDDDGNALIVGPGGGNVQGVVTTFKDDAFNFATLNTFAMPDTVVQFQPLTGTPIPVSRAGDRTILDRVRSDLIARGYTDVTGTGQQASFVVLVGTTATQNYNAFVGYPWFVYWGFSPIWNTINGVAFDNSWTIVYPWYPVVGVTAYDRGTLIVDFIPTLQVNPVAKSVKSAWAGVASAVLAGQITASSLNAAVDQMFAQSPYLVPGPVVNPLGQRQPPAQVGLSSR